MTHKDSRFDIEQLTLSPYEKAIEESADSIHDSMTPETQDMYNQIQQRVADQKTKPITFKAKAKQFEMFKRSAQDINVPYTKILNFLIELRNKGEIRMK